MTLDLDALEAVARAATPDGELGSYTFAGIEKLLQFQSKVSPNTVLALITRIREAERRAGDEATRRQIDGLASDYYEAIIRAERAEQGETEWEAQL